MDIARAAAPELAARKMSARQIGAGMEADRLQARNSYSLTVSIPRLVTVPIPRRTWYPAGDNLLYRQKY